MSEKSHECLFATEYFSDTSDFSCSSAFYGIAQLFTNKQSKQTLNHVLQFDGKFKLNSNKVKITYDFKVKIAQVYGGNIYKNPS